MEQNNLTPWQNNEINLIYKTLKDLGGNKVKTAKFLGIGRQTLYNKIHLYEIKSKEGQLEFRFNG